MNSTPLPALNKLLIVGVGLIGGSFALALKQAGGVRHVVGVGRSEQNLQQALQRGVIDEIASDLPTAAGDADLVLLAVPVGQMGGVMQQLAPVLPAHAVVTDAGSTKQDVVALARTHFAGRLASFVPAHPIAGAEKSGATAAKPDLYVGRKLVLTPLADTSTQAVQRVRAVWQACGAQICEMSPEQHDAVFAAVSHLPHLLAFALVEEIAGKPSADQFFRFAASGFRDFTRIASSSPEMWRDISLANRHAILQELADYQSQLERLQGFLQQADGDALLSLYSRARQAREDWIHACRPAGTDS